MAYFYLREIRGFFPDVDRFKCRAHFETKINKIAQLHNKLFLLSCPKKVFEIMGLLCSKVHCTIKMAQNITKFNCLYHPSPFHGKSVVEVQDGSRKNIREKEKTIRCLHGSGKGL